MHKRDIIPSKKELQTVCEFVATENECSTFQIAIADNIGYHTSLEYYIRGNVKRGFTGCNAGITTIRIDLEGNVKGCESLYDENLIEGNITITSLYDIWTAPNSFSYNRKFRQNMLKGKCANCDTWEKCTAGCRSFNYF